MSRHRLYIGLLLCAITGLLCSPALGQDEGERQLYGQVVTGFSGVDYNGEAANSPYVGLNANLMGFWKDPRILTFDVNPTLFTGFQWDGPMSGPQTNGVSADATFLGGSHIPLRLYFSHEYIPSPDLGQGWGADAQGFSKTQQNFGLDWTADFRHWPTLRLHYSDDSYDSHYPADLGGDANNRNQDFRVSLDYLIAKWRLNGGFSRDTASAETPLALSLTGQNYGAETHSKSFYINATRPLPFNSNLNINAAKSDSDYDLGTTTRNSFTRATGSLTSNWTQRLTTSLQTSYVTSYADYARQQVLQPGGGDINPDNPLFYATSGVLTYGVGATFRILHGLNATGNYNQTHVVDVSDPLFALGDGHSYGAGLSYNHKLFDGQFGASYTITDWTIQVPEQQNTGTPGNGLTAGEERSLNQMVNVSYSHRLPWQIDFSGGGDVSKDKVEYVYNDHVTSWGIEANLNRSLGNNWSLHGRANLRKGEHEYPFLNKTSYETYSLAATSKRLQFTLTKMLDHGLAYQFGSGVVLTPGAGDVGYVPGMLPLIQTDGDFFAASAAYKVNRRWSVWGTWQHGNRSVEGINSIAQNGYSLRTSYNFRKVSVSAGLLKNWENFLRTGDSQYYTRTFYFELRRDFRIF